MSRRSPTSAASRPRSSSRTSSRRSIIRWYSHTTNGSSTARGIAQSATDSVARSLCTDGVRTRYLGAVRRATHWEGVDLEWGSRPDIDDYVRWSGTRCHHDAYGLTRQERLDVIADYVESDAPTLDLQTCNVRMDGNCRRCEKCYRTAVGLRLSGLEPTAHGYPFDETEYDRIRRTLEGGEWELGEDERYMWADIRDRVRETTPESAAERAFRVAGRRRPRGARLGGRTAAVGSTLARRREERSDSTLQRGVPGGKIGADRTRARAFGAVTSQGHTDWLPETGRYFSSVSSRTPTSIGGPSSSSSLRRRPESWSVTPRRTTGPDRSSSGLPPRTPRPTARRSVPVWTECDGRYRVPRRPRRS